ncbi:MAG: hypothetical protein GY727_06020, partial [Gammaproteobacteria bacterium]|nr:hypothetical protein [Gammaproteobacteria bacterium]
LEDNINVTINVIPDPGVSPPPGFLAAATVYVNFVLSPNPSPLASPGATIVLPLAFPLPAYTALSLFKYDPDTGSLTNTEVVGTVDSGGNTATFTGVTTFSNFAAFQVANQPPVAECQNITVPADDSCSANASIDDGSSDPDGGTFIITQVPEGPYPLGDTLVTLTITDDSGESNSCSAIVTVVDNSCPTVTAQLVPVNVKSRQGCFRVTFSAEDNCDQSPQVVAVLNDTHVDNNQLVTLVHKKKSSVKTNVDGFADCGTTKIQGTSFTLTATAIDGAGNVTCEEAIDTFSFR